MPTFLDNISVYNAKASSAIADAVKEGQVERANMLSALKTAANDISLSSDVRLNALTALINLGGLLEIPLPPYFPVSTTYANTQTYIGLHNDLTGLQGGAPGEYLHLTQAEKDSIAGKASLSQINFGNLLGLPGENPALAAALSLKQDAISGNGFVKASGGTITYDANTYLQTITGIAAGGDLEGLYPSPTISNSSVINKALTGFNGAATWSAITPLDTIITAIQKLNAYVVGASAVTGGVNSVALTLPNAVFTYTSTPATGAVMLSGGFVNQAQNKLFAGPSAGGTGQPSFRFLVPQDLPTTGIGTGTIGSTSQIPVITYDNYGRITNITTIAASNGGVVNTVGFTVPAGGIFDKTIGGTTTDPVINFQVLDQDPNKIWAGPSSGSATAGPTFRLLVPNDIPSGIPQSKITNLDATFQTKLSTSLNTSRIFIGNASGVAVQSVVSGDLTAAYSFPESTHLANFTIKNKAVTYAKFADVPDDPANTIRPILLGRFTAGQGPMQQLTLDPLAFNYNVTSGEIGLVTPNPPSLTDAGDLLTSSGSNVLQRLGLPVDYATKGYLLVPYVGTTTPDIKLIWGEANGDITYSIDTTTTPGTPFPNFVIGANKVTLGKIQTIPTNTILGNNGLLGASPSALTPADVVDMLPLQDATTGLTKGVVPASGFSPASGKTKADYFLNANNGWSLGVGGSGNNPGGSAAEIQYRSGATTFGGITSLQYDGSVYVNSLAQTFAIVDNVTTPTASVILDISATTLAQTWNFPDATSGATFVGEDLIQTLTNKTLSTGLQINPVPGSGQKGDMWYSDDNSGTVALLPNPGADKYLKFNSSANYPEWVTISIPSGTINAASQYSVPYYSTAGSADAISGITPPSGTAGTYFLRSYLSSASAVLPTWIGSTGTASTGLVVLDDTPTILQPRFGNGAGNGHIHMRRGGTPGGLASNATLAFLSASKTMSIEFDTDNFQSQFLFAAASATKIYTFPNESGTVVLNAFKTVSDGTSSFSGSGSDTLTLKADGTYIDAVYNTGAKSVSMNWIGPDIIAPASGLGIQIAYWSASGLTGSTTIFTGNQIPVVNTAGTDFIAATTTRQQLNFLSGASGVTGSNAIVFGTSPAIFTPTITSATLAAGTASAAPLNFTVDTNLLTTASAGAMEYDGTVPFFSIAASTRGVLQSQQLTLLGSTYTLTSQTAAQKLFNVTANGAVTLPIGTFEFVCFFSLTSMSASSGSFGFALGGNATIASQGWHSIAQKGTATLSTATAGQLTYSTAANTAITTASVNTTGYAFIRGVIRITNGGTVIPQVSLGVAAAAVVGINSYFKISPISRFNSGGLNVGNWS